jgi:hypothetical protein
MDTLIFNSPGEFVFPCETIVGRIPAGPDVTIPSEQLVRLADLLDTGIIEVICPHCLCEFEK